MEPNSVLLCVANNFRWRGSNPKYSVNVVTDEEIQILCSFSHKKQVYYIVLTGVYINILLILLHKPSYNKLCICMFSKIIIIVFATESVWLSRICCYCVVCMLWGTFVIRLHTTIGIKIMYYYTSKVIDNEVDEGYTSLAATPSLCCWLLCSRAAMRTRRRSSKPCI